MGAKIFFIAVIILSAAFTGQGQKEGQAVASDSAATFAVPTPEMDSSVTKPCAESGEGSTISKQTAGKRHGRFDRLELLSGWVLGCRIENLGLESFPGTLFLQRRIGKLRYVGLGLSYSRKEVGPEEKYSNNDSSYIWKTSSSSYLSLYPEYIRNHGIGGWLFSISIRGLYQHSYWENERVGWDIRPERRSSGKAKSHGTSDRLGIEFPLAIERQFRLGRILFSSGLVCQFLSVYTSKSNETTITNTTTERRQFKEPLGLKFNSPFNGSASIQLKCWF